MPRISKTQHNIRGIKLVSLVIPVYNSEDLLHLLVDEIDKGLVNYKYEVVFVNDSSRDESLSVLRDLAMTRSNITVIDLSRNFGQHNAIMAGLRFARGDVLVLMDDDLQHPPAEIRKLLETMEKNDYDVVYGNYIAKKHNFFRNLGSRLNDVMATKLIKKPKDLYFCSFKAIRAFIAKEIVQYAGAYPYIDGLIFRATNNIGSASVIHKERMIGASNYTFSKLLSLWFNMFTNFSILPLRMVTLLGFFMSLLSFVFAAYVFIERHTFTVIQQGWASIMVSIMLLSGVQLASIGFLGEYLGRTYLTVNQTPQYVIRQVISSSSRDENGRV